jgi:TolB-like protein
MSEQRKLATIMAVDVAGYSQAAEADESAAADAVRRERAVIEVIIGPLGGRIFNTAGDGFMIELPTASAGVEAATQLLAAPDAPQVRIGLHLGEVIVAENGDLLGHGVNVAARLQQMAEPGSALVSQAVQAQIHSGRVKLTPLGKVQLDKMHDRIDVFALAPNAKRSFRRVLWRRTRRALVALLVIGVLGVGGYAAWRMYGPQQTAETPRLAVLRFEMQGEAEPYFAEAVADDLISYVGRMDGLEVIARASSFALTGERATPANAARELGATLVMTGAVQRLGARIRVSAQLSEAPSGRQVWARDFERPAEEIYLLQGEIAANVALAAGLRASAAAARRVDPEAYDLYSRAREALLGDQRMDESIILLEQAVARDANFAEAWSLLAQARIRRAGLQWMTAPVGVPISAEALNLGLDAADRAIALDPASPIPHEQRSTALLYLGRLEDALDAADTAGSRGGAGARIYNALGYSGRATTDMRRIANRDPLNAEAWQTLGLNCGLIGDIACAVDALQQADRLRPNRAPFFLAIALHRAGRSNEALQLTRERAAAWRDTLAPEPFFSLEVMRAMLGEGAPPSDAAIAGATARGEVFVESAVQLLMEINRPEAVAPLLQYWTEASGPSRFFLYDRRLTPLRATPEFWALMEREGVVRVWRSTGQWPDFCERERSVCEQHLGPRPAR